MTVKEILAQLKSLGNDARRKHNTKAGAPENQFGVKLGDIRAIAKKIKTERMPVIVPMVNDFFDAKPQKQKKPSLRFDALRAVAGVLRASAFVPMVRWTLDAQRIHDERNRMR